LGQKYEALSLLGYFSSQHMADTLSFSMSARPFFHMKKNWKSVGLLSIGVHTFRNAFSAIFHTS